MKENEFKLDLKDRRILYELDSNCRQSSSQIGKKVSLSPEVVNYRIKKLEQERIITQYQVALDLDKLGIIQFKILLSFQHMNSESMNKIIRELEKNKSVKWIVSCNGSWDLMIALEAESISEINSLKTEVLSAFENYIDRKAISVCASGFVYNRDYLIDKKNYNRTRVLVSGAKKEKLDRVDLEILKKLAENARKPIVDIANQLKTSARVVNYRIRQLIKEKIITGFRIAINYEKLGIKFYKTFFYLDNPKQERINKLAEYFASNKNVIHNLHVVGNWDFEPEFEVYSEQEFNRILNEMKDKFSDIIKNIDIVTISKEHKFVYL
ncbi:MAG: Lrp/AsnC family transcriptional regulator [Nanoarchaeota archaeon]|nr:Lrp/AsnC family transcriptional regulator [Nanoarchaeota archaeon]MBU4085980.1 Lrp/AsnC family transcriptional regulator [Nanoarchaeota archaeon]